MVKPLNWVLSGIVPKKQATRVLRNRLAATTILAVVPFLGYGRQAYADCVPNGDVIECSGDTNPNPPILQDNANVVTLAAPPFSTDDGVYIRGDGHIQFTDNNASTINNDDGRGLSVISNRDFDGPDENDEVPGAVTIITNGTVTGNDGTGIYAYNGYNEDTTGDLTITVDGEVTGRDVGPASDFGIDGIYAKDFGHDLTITTGAQSVVTGDDNAIDARNYNTGSLEINVNGQATSFDYDGVFARNGSFEGGNEVEDLTVNIGATAAVDGAGNGVNAQNYGTGDLTITVDGQGEVTGRGFDAVRAYNYGNDLTVTTDSASTLTGASNGIDARNMGSGDLLITADGVVTGNNNDGIFALNVDGAAYVDENPFDEEPGRQFYGNAGSLTIVTGVGSVVQGGGNGIGATNYGYGDLTIEANGLVGGYAEDGDGIHAFNYAGEDISGEYPDYIYREGHGKNLRITTGVGSTVRGGDDGIQADNEGTGELKIIVGGEVTGKGSEGINAHNLYGFYEDDDQETPDTALTIITLAGSNVTGQGDNGIVATNRGRGTFTINANGNVSGLRGDGIFASNDTDYWGGPGGQAMTITTGPGTTVIGHFDDGIDAYQGGNGNLTITVSGTVTGLGDSYEDYNSYGIEASHFGSGDGVTDIKVYGNALVQGEDAGIRATTNNRFVSIYNAGLTRNLSGESHDRAIITDTEDDASTYVDNVGNLIGTVEFRAYEANDTLDNSGFWNMAGGDSDFGGDGGIDLFVPAGDVVNNTGTLVAADAAGILETSRIFNLERFNNDGGLISLLDGDHDDTLIMTTETLSEYTGNVGGTLVYTGTDGRLVVDAALGQGTIPATDHLSDELIIRGSTTGTTTVGVNVVAANGANFEGIPVVRVEGGTSDDFQFVLDGPVSGGFFLWGMRYDETNNWHELYTLTENPDGTGDPILGPGASEFPAGFAASQDIWFQTVGTVLHRQADLRALLQNVAVTPVADYGDEPVEPTPIGVTMAPGFWFKGFGTFIDRDDRQNGFDLDREQTIYGGMAGFDFGTREAFDNAWLFGVFGGYIGSKLDFKADNTKWDYQGPTVGAYVTYLDSAFYADATVKVDFLDIDMDAGADDASTDAVNIGGRIDTGYKFGHTAFIEPQASLAVVNSEVDDTDIFGGTVEFDDDTSVRGRLGLRVGVEHTGDNSTVYSADVTASAWENFTGGDSDVTVADTGVADFGISDDQGSTYGDISLGLGAANPDGWSSFVRGNYLFADDYEAFSGNAGVRFVW